MARLLPIVIIITLFAGVLFYIRSQTSLKSPVPVVEISQKIESNINSSSEEKIKTLEESVKLLATEIGKVNLSLDSLKKGGATNTTSPMTETRLKNLETAVNNLQADINSLKSPTSQTTGNSTKRSPEYIPLGSGGTSGDRNYNSITSYQVSIDPADYSGYSGMQLEVIFNLNEAVGTANARVYNSSDAQVVGSSNVSTTSTTSSVFSSGNFKLPSGRKIYVLQVQSTQGYTVNIQSARIKVSF